jgi:Flp pilus assembly protein TadD
MPWELLMGDHLFQQCYSALMYDEVEDYQYAIQMLTKHLTANPSNAAAYNNRAVAFWEIGQLDGALADFAQAVRLAPDDASPAKNRGMLLQRMGDLPAALAELDLAVRIAPDDPYVRRTRAHARAEARELAGAAEDFSRAIELQPDFAQQYLDRAAVYERMGQSSLAELDRIAASQLARPT